MHTDGHFAIAVNKNGKIIPPYFMLVFQQECISAFETHVLVSGGSSQFWGEVGLVCAKK